MVKGNTYLTGSLIATAGITGSFTGSLTGTATSASLASGIYTPSGTANRILFQAGGGVFSSTTTDSNLQWTAGSSTLSVGSLQILSSGRLQSSIDVTNNISLHDGTFGTLAIRNNNVDKIAIYRNGLIALSGSTQITGSLNVSTGITGSLSGTASYATQALSASWAPSAGGAAFPYSGSAQITGSLVISSSNATQLTLLGSGSTVPIFTVQGSQGELFSITDSLSGSLFSVNDVSGLPILEVFSDSTTFIGDYQAPALYTTKKITASSGVNLVYSLSTGSYDGVFMDYIIRSGSNSRAGTFTALWGSGGAVNYMDNSTTDFGSTSGFTFGASISGSNMIVTGSASTTGWTIKSIIRSI